MIDVLLVGGYLGAGKTSLVNHLLRSGTGRRTLVLVNDFGKVAVEDELVSDRDAEMVTLTNGCVCCSMASPLIDTFVAIRDRPDPPELVVLETSGVADPGPVSHHAMIPGFGLLGIVVVADAATVRRRADDELVGRTIRRQLAAADLVVLNKTDLVPDTVLAATNAWVAASAPRAQVVDASHGVVPVARLLGVARPERRSEARDHHDHADTAVDDPHVTITWTPSGPVDRDALLDVLRDPGSGIVRAKGTLRFAGRPDERVLLQAVDGLVDVVATSGSSEAVQSDQSLVLIGLRGTFRADEIHRRLVATLRRPVTWPHRS